MKWAHELTKWAWINSLAKESPNCGKKWTLFEYAIVRITAAKLSVLLSSSSPHTNQINSVYKYEYASLWEEEQSYSYNGAGNDLDHFKCVVIRIFLNWKTESFLKDLPWKISRRTRTYDVDSWKMFTTYDSEQLLNSSPASKMQVRFETEPWKNMILDFFHRCTFQQSKSVYLADLRAFRYKFIVG